jgi:hypothetical protein
MLKIHVSFLFEQVATLAQQMCEANESTKKAVAALIVEIEGQSWSDAEFNSKSTTSFGLFS